MTEKRKYPRYLCKIKTKFEYFEGDPEEYDRDISIPNNGKGFIMDISRGGSFIVTKERVNIGMPIKIKFSTSKNKHLVEGRIVRTGLLENNPSEVAQRFSKYSAKGDAYIAVEFNNVLESLTADEL